MVVVRSYQCHMLYYDTKGPLLWYGTITEIRNWAPLQPGPETYCEYPMNQKSIVGPYRVKGIGLECLGKWKIRE